MIKPAAIILCTYLGCPVRDKCQRATTKPGRYPAYMLNPSRQVDGKFECRMYIGPAQNQLMKQLIEIVNGKETTKEIKRTQPAAKNKPRNGHDKAL